MHGHLLSRLKALLPFAATLLGPALLAVPTSTSTFTAASTPAVRINEVLAANTRIAHAGTFPDVIELHNAGATAADLSGKSLSDDPLLPRKFVFPAGTSIAAGGYLVVYADSELTAPGLHTDFALDAEGDQVRLYDTPANGALLDSIVFGFQISQLLRRPHRGRVEHLDPHRADTRRRQRSGHPRRARRREDERMGREDHLSPRS